jgi:flagellar protein FliS
MMRNKLRSYQTVDTLGKSSAELVVKVYEGAISCLNEAIRQYQAENIPRGYEELEKAKKFIVHLYTTLDEKKGGDIAKKLSQLYAFIMEQLNLAQVRPDLSTVENSITILNNLREGWVQLAENYGRKAGLAGNRFDKEQEIKNLSLSV